MAWLFDCRGGLAAMAQIDDPADYGDEREMGAAMAAAGYEKTSSDLVLSPFRT